MTGRTLMSQPSTVSHVAANRYQFDIRFPCFQSFGPKKQGQMMSGQSMIASVFGAIAGFVTFLGSLVGIAVGATSLRTFFANQRTAYDKTQQTAEAARMAEPPNAPSVTRPATRTPLQPLRLRPTTTSIPPITARYGSKPEEALKRPRSEPQPLRPPTYPSSSGPTVETAVIAWLTGVVVAGAACYFGSRMAHRVLLDYVVDQFDLELPPLGNFTPPWTWVTCAGAAAVVLGIAVGTEYDFFDTKLGVVAVFSLSSLLALPASFVAIGVAEGVGWALWNYVDFSFALGAWLALGASALFAIGTAVSEELA
jgi:hypothetical protein